MMKSGQMFRKLRIVPVLAVLFAFSLSNIAQAKNVFDWRIVLLPTLNITSKKMMQDVGDYAVRMSKAGYNGLFVDGAKMRNLEGQTATVRGYMNNLLAVAKQNGIAVIPMSQGQGGNQNFITTDRTLAFPCKGTRFVVSNGIATAKGDATVFLANGGFEGGVTGWSKSPNFKIDHAVKRSGIASLRCDNPNTTYVRAGQQVTVKPYQTYELSMWVRTQNIVAVNTKYGDKGCQDIAFTVQSPGVNYIYSDRYFRNGLGRNSDWKQVKACFHSLDRTSVKISIQASRGLVYNGTVWFDDVTLTEVGLATAVNRPGLDVVVKTAAGKALTSGADYVVGNRKLTIPAGSVAQNGDELLVDWYKEANVVSSEAGVAMCYDDVWNAVRREIALDDEWFNTPKARLMKYSEWRVAGWDPVCRLKYQVDQVGSGRLMAGVANITHGLYREANGSRLSIVFNDAYDPYHNSKASYYVINGGCVGSGYNLDPNIIVLNWNAHGRTESLKFFAGTEGINRPGWGIKTSKQRQIISCNPASTGDWIKKVTALETAGKLVDGDVIGIAHHTYKTFPEWYQKIEAMAATCRTAGRWGTGPIPFPAPTPGIPFKGVGVKEARHNSPIGLSLATIRNATSSEMALRFNVPKNQAVGVAIFNLRGQKIANVLSERMSAGTYERKVDMSRMAPGVYFARLEVAGKGVRRITKKMMVF